MACPMDATHRIEETFPGALREKTFVKRTLSRTKRHGFTAENTIACVGTCRDEVCASLGVAVAQLWGEAFNFSSLSGFPFLGKTGVGAARTHAPIEDGKERYAFFAMPHIGVTRSGVLGACHRAGQTEPNVACGALDCVRLNLEAGPLKTEIDLEDIEISLIRRAMAPVIPPGEKPDLVTLTRLALGLIERDLERLITLCVGSAKADYAVFTGIQINAPGGNWILPSQSYVVVDWARIPVPLDSAK